MDNNLFENKNIFDDNEQYEEYGNNQGLDVNLELSDNHHSSHRRSRQKSHHHHHSHRRSRKNNFILHKKSKLRKWIKKQSKRKLIAICVAISIVFVSLGCLFYKEVLRPNGYENKNQEEMLNYAETVVSTIPAYWNDEIKLKTNVVKELQIAGGRDCASFVWASDTHIPDNSNGMTNNLGNLMAKMMDNCNIPFAVLTGDIGTRSSSPDESEMMRLFDFVPKHLSPLWGTERLLVALGNHDGTYGDSQGYYKKQLSPEEMWEYYFRGQALDTRRVFSKDGLYFYVDNPTQKIRYIVLNSQFAGEYAIDENGYAINNRFSVSCYGQKQLDWFANIALNMPSGYGAVIATHVPPTNLQTGSLYTKDASQLCGIINAYNTKSTFSASYTSGIDGWTNSTVNVNFNNAKGEIIAVFTGHEHRDNINTMAIKCPIITIIAAGADVNSGESPERKFFTDKETSFDVVTINRKTRTIYLTRVGSGEDRKVNY